MKCLVCKDCGCHIVYDSSKEMHKCCYNNLRAALFKAPDDVMKKRFEKDSELLLTWLKRDLRINSIIKSKQENNIGEYGLSVMLYTKEHEYYINMIVHEDGQSSYLGCTFYNRYRNVDEKHHRGNDLSDGVFDEETYNKILKDIVSTEMTGIRMLR